MNKDIRSDWISEGDDEVEALIVEIWANDFPVHIVTAYGPQLSDFLERKQKFWHFTEREVLNGDKVGAGFILQMPFWAKSLSKGVELSVWMVLLPLGMVDDLLTISLCGYGPTMMNEFINCKTAIKRLQFGEEEKCVKLHVGKTCDQNLCKDLAVDGWNLNVKEDAKTGNCVQV